MTLEHQMRRQLAAKSATYTPRDRADDLTRQVRGRRRRRTAVTGAVATLGVVAALGAGAGLVNAFTPNRSAPGPAGSVTVTVTPAPSDTATPSPAWTGDVAASARAYLFPATPADVREQMRVEVFVNRKAAIDCGENPDDLLDTKVPTMDFKPVLDPGYYVEFGMFGQGRTGVPVEHRGEWACRSGVRGEVFGGGLGEATRATWAGVVPTALRAPHVVADENEAIECLARTANVPGDAASITDGEELFRFQVAAATLYHQYTGGDAADPSEAKAFGALYAKCSRGYFATLGTELTARRATQGPAFDADVAELARRLTALGYKPGA